MSAAFDRLTIWVVGTGNMGGAMLRGWLAAGVKAENITAIDPGATSAPDGVTLFAAPPENASAPDILLLAVKPQLLDVVAPAVAPCLAEGTIFISILAGVEIASLRKRFATPQAVVRVMPNTPVAVGKGVMAVYGDGLNDQNHATVGTLMAAIGHLEWIEREDLFDAVTAVSGCGPAFLFRFIDAMAKAGEALGLPADQSARLALATVEGSALLAALSDESPAILADRVASPGGATREGMNVMDADNRVNDLLRDTLEAAAKRSAELATAARG